MLFLIFFSLTENHSTPLSSKQLQADPAVSVKILDYDFTTAIVSCAPAKWESFAVGTKSAGKRSNVRGKYRGRRNEVE